MFISEIYQSNQGEGQLTGTPSVFVRTSGCNLRCGFCDTPFASWHPEGEKLSVAEVVDRTAQNAGGSQHVVVTGRDATPKLIEAADLVSEVVKVKHPMDEGIRAQQGIEW